MSKTSWSSLTQWMAYAVIVAVALLLAMVPAAGPYFAWFFPDLNPAWVILLASALGAACLAALHLLAGFEILKRGLTMRGFAVGAALATLLGIAIVGADIVLRYPQAINAPLPQGLAFYPSVGLLAEVVFHLLPLTLLLLLLLPVRSQIGKDRTVWIAITLVAIAEPTFQVFFGGDTGFLALYTWLHVFAIAFAQLYLFRRYDFVSMYTMRLVYYGYWHLLWGTLRLRILF